MNIDEKVDIIKEVGEEIIDEGDLRKLLEKVKNPIAYDGFEPSGQIHIAQGLLRAINVNKLTSTGIRFKFWVADYFAMLNNKYGGDLDKIRIAGEYAIEVWKSCGMDLEKVEFVWASEFFKAHPEYWETVLKLAMNSTISRVMKCGQIMGREENTSNPSAQILYPLMQAADIIHLEANIAQLGLDQRKVNMLARDIFPKIGKRKPVCIHHHMLLGLQSDGKDLEGVDRKIAMKMSKSKPETAIFMTDSAKDIAKKFNKAHSIDGEVEDNPVLEYFKYIIFEKYDEILVERPEKFGGNLKFKSYLEMEKSFASSDLKSVDLKMCASKYINELLEPIRKHFETDKRAKDLLEKVKSFQVTR
ncbi:MAG: tyrosine--tRNA ligase [Nanoarchaeota archaeon]|nr:tyrosine--tRNA ligase [Nanoarchaeota archaeon]